MTHCMDVGFIPHKHESWPHRYAELKIDTKIRWWNGHYRKKGVPEFTYEVLPAGSTVKIVMASRFGDVGITPRLDEEYGYQARVTLDDLTNLRKDR